MVADDITDDKNGDWLKLVPRKRPGSYTVLLMNEPSYVSVLQALCSAVTVCQFFFHTALFTWMLVEGINLYIKLVKVFSVKTQYVAYSAIGWGELQIPIIYSMMPFKIHRLNVKQILNSRFP